MLNCTLNEVDSFKSVFKKIDEVILEVVLDVDSEGISFGALDKSHSLFMNVDMDMDYFTEFRISEPLHIALDSTELNKVLNRLKSKQEVSITATDDSFVLSACNNDNVKDYELKLVNTDNEIMTPPQLEYESEFMYTFAKLKETIKDCELYDMKAQFSVDNEVFSVSADGTMGKFRSTDTVEALDTMGSNFSIDKINHILQCDKVSKGCIIKLSENMPLEIIIEGTGIIVKYMLAPLMNVEDM